MPKDPKPKDEAAPVADDDLTDATRKAASASPEYPHLPRKPSVFITMGDTHSHTRDVIIEMVRAVEAKTRALALQDFGYGSSARLVDFQQLDLLADYSLTWWPAYPTRHMRSRIFDRPRDDGRGSDLPDWLKQLALKPVARADTRRRDAANAVAKAAWVLWKDDPEKVGELVRRWTPQSELLSEAAQRMLALGREQGYLTPNWAFERIERWLRGGDADDREAALKAAQRLFEREPEGTLKVFKQWFGRGENFFDLFLADLCDHYVGLAEGQFYNSRAALESQLKRMESVVKTLKETHESFLDAKQTAADVATGARRESRTSESPAPLIWRDESTRLLHPMERDPKDVKRRRFPEGAPVKRQGGRRRKR